MSLPRRLLGALAGFVVTVTALAGCAWQDGPAQSEPARSDVGVQLFQWTWDAIGRECTEVLGPAGYGWVLTSPPQEHILGPQWWTAYQPVSYQVESRLGDREQFAAMVQACSDAGVEVIADAVINHMTGQHSPGTGWAGSPYEHYVYPGLYDFGDFHHCGLTPNDDIVDYRDAEQVRTCELSNLADLATETQHVQDTLGEYLADLLSLGVAGFRIDAAKHMDPADIAAVLAGLPEGTRVMQEVIGASGEPIQPGEYTGNGQVFDFYFGRELASYVGGGSLGRILGIGAGTTGLTGEQAIVFIDNHDTERNGSTLRYRDGERYELAMVLMLATDYGTPVVTSSYAFGMADRDLGPAQDEEGRVLDAECAAQVGPDYEPADQEWICQHRWDGVAGMVGWRAVAGQEPVTDVQSESSTLALRRGEAVLLANGGSKDAEIGYASGLTPGEYCDVLTGPATAEGCAGKVVTVSEGGDISVSVPAGAAVAIHGGARAGSGTAGSAHARG